MRGQGYHWFRPESGRFDEEAYVIFEKTENPMAQRVIYDMSIQKDLVEAEKAELSRTLLQLAKKEQEKEAIYLYEKIAEIDPTKRSEFYQRAITILQNKDHRGQRFSALFNLFLQGEKEMATLLKDGADPLNNSVHSRGFDKYLQNYFKQVEGKLAYGARNFDGIDSFLGGNVSFSVLLDRYVQEYFYGDGSAEVVATANLHREKIRKEMSNNKVFGPIFNQYFDKPITPQRLLEALRNAKTSKSGKDLTVRQLIDSVIPRVTKGLDLEVQIATNKPTTVKARHVGAEGNKTDVYYSDKVTLNKTVDLGLADMFGPGVSDQLKADINNRRAAFSRVKNQIFNISISAKDYRSRHNFQVSASSFKNSGAQLSPIAKGMNSDFIRHLEFYLNNTVPGAMLANKRQEVLDNVALIIAAYMFDDIEDMFLSSSVDGLLHLYNINGVYHSLSDLLFLAGEDVLAIDPMAVAVVSYDFSSDIIQTTKDRYAAHNGSYPIGGDAKLEWDQVRDVVQDTILNIKMKREAIKNSTINLQALLK